MSTLFLSNTGRTVNIQIDDITLQYLGPKNLNKFIKINKVTNGCIYVDTMFIDDEQHIEEDYIDIRDILNEYGYNTNAILSSITNYVIQQGDIRMNKMELINTALMVSDNFALISKIGSAQDIQIVAINMHKTEYKAVIRLKDFSVLSSNMKESMLKRAVAAVKARTQQREKLALQEGKQEGILESAKNLVNSLKDEDKNANYGIIIQKVV